MIVKKGNKYAVVSKSGKQMGEYDSKAEATKRLKQIEYFKMKAKKKTASYKDGGKVTKEMVDKMDSKMRNEQNATATQLSKELKQGYKMVDGFPRPLTAAQKKDNKKELARTQEKLKKPTSYKYVGTKVPSYSKGGKMMKYLKGGQVKLDANKDGQITGADFMMLRKK